MDNLWTSIEKKDEVGKCEKCGKKIWKYWHIGKQEMTKCGPCFFKK